MLKKIFPFFFGTGLLLVLILGLSSSLFAQTEIGLQVYSFDKQFHQDVPATLDKIQKIGFKELEAGSTYGMSFTDFKKLLDLHGLHVVSYGSDFDKLQYDPMTVVREAKAWGASYVACFWIPHKDDSFGIEEIQKAVVVFNNAGKILRENGLLLCYHPHGFEFRPYQDGTLFDYLVKNTDPRWINFEMDVYWVKNSGQEPLALLSKYPGRFPLLHLKDRRRGTVGNLNGNSDKESNVVLGTGDVGIEAIMKAAKKAGVKHYFIEDESSSAEQQVPASLAYLKTLP
jgi:sugar phosphate isomerase/epimerase